MCLEFFLNYLIIIPCFGLFKNTFKHFPLSKLLLLRHGELVALRTESVTNQSRVMEVGMVELWTCIIAWVANLVESHNALSLGSKLAMSIN